MGRAEITRDLVVFDEIQRRYRPDESIFLVYTLDHAYTPSKRDWVGLFKTDWKAFHEYIAFEWAPKQPKRDKFPLVRSVYFMASDTALTPSDTQEYRFLYVSRKKGVVGSSTAFKISEYPDQLTVRCRDAGHDDFTLIETSVSGADADSFVVIDGDGTESGRISPIPWERSDAGDPDFSDAFAELWSTESVKDAKMQRGGCEKRKDPAVSPRKARRRSSTSLLLLENPEKARPSAPTKIGGLDLLVTAAEIPELDATATEERLWVVPYKSFLQDCGREIKVLAEQERVQECDFARRFGVPLSLEKDVCRQESSKRKGRKKAGKKRSFVGPLSLRDTILQQVLNPALTTSQKALLRANIDAFLSPPWTQQGAARACAQAIAYPLSQNLCKTWDGILRKEEGMAMVWKMTEKRFKILQEKLQTANEQIASHNKRVEVLNDQIRSLRMRLDKSRYEGPLKRSASTNTTPRHSRNVSSQTKQQQSSRPVSAEQALRAERDTLLERVQTLTSAKQQQEKAARKLTSELGRLRDKRHDLEKYVDDVIFTLCTMGYTYIVDTKGNRTDLSSALPESVLKGRRGKQLTLPAFSEDRPLKMKSHLLEMKILQTEAEKAEAQVLNLKTEIDHQTTQARQLRTETDELKAKISMLDSESARLRAENAELATKADGLKAENAELREDAETAKDKNDDLLTDMIFLKEEVKEKERELQSAICREKTLAGLLQEENEDRKKLGQQLSAARVDLASVKGERDALMETVEQQRHRAGEMESAAQEKDRDARRETEKLKLQIAELEARLLVAETAAGLSETCSGVSCTTPAAFNAPSDTPPTTTVTTTHLKVLPKEGGKRHPKDQDASLRSPPTLVPGVAHRMMLGAGAAIVERGASSAKQSTEVSLFLGSEQASSANSENDAADDSKVSAATQKRKSSLERKLSSSCSATKQPVQEPKQQRIPRKRPVRGASTKKNRSTCPYCREAFPAGTEKTRILKHIAAHSKK